MFPILGFVIQACVFVLETHFAAASHSQKFSLRSALKLPGHYENINIKMSQVSVHARPRVGRRRGKKNLMKCDSCQIGHRDRFYGSALCEVMYLRLCRRRTPVLPHHSQQSSLFRTQGVKKLQSETIKQKQPFVFFVWFKFTWGFFLIFRRFGKFLNEVNFKNYSGDELKYIHENIDLYGQKNQVLLTLNIKNFSCCKKCFPLARLDVNWQFRIANGMGIITKVVLRAPLSLKSVARESLSE